MSEETGRCATGVAFPTSHTSHTSRYGLAQERDRFARALLGHGENDVARDLADLLDVASMSPDARRQLARVLEALSGEAE
jgi:hypothetical protein